MHRHMRDISAAVFSQPYSEELEDPPAYKPPLPASAGRPKIPTTIATGTTGKVAEVKKKLDELAQEVSNQSLADEENFDDDEYFGKSKFGVNLPGLSIKLAIICFNGVVF